MHNTQWTQRPDGLLVPSRESLKEAGLDRIADDILALIRPGLRLDTTPVDEDAVPLGQTRFGGRPDLSAAEAWPVWEGLPLSFLGQLNLGELAAFPCAKGLLPPAGMLYFFYDSQQRTWGYDPKHKGSWRVLFAEEVGDLVRTDAPSALEFGEYLPCSVSIAERPTHPAFDAFAVEQLELSQDEIGAYLEWSEIHMPDPGPESHQVLGWPVQIQGDMQLECQLVSHGLYVGDGSGYTCPEARDLKLGASDWRLLLQIDSDDDSNMMWGDMGRLYFMITEAALKSRRFDESWMVLQCS